MRRLKRSESSFVRGVRALLSSFCLVLTICTFASVLRRQKLIRSDTKARLGKGSSAVFFFAPKPGFKEIPENILAWRHELKSIQGDIVLFLNDEADRSKAKLLGIHTEYVQEAASGLPLLSSILDTIAHYSQTSAVGFGNSDISPGENLARVLLPLLRLDYAQVPPHIVDSELVHHKMVDRSERGWLIVLTRVDYETQPSLGTFHKGGGVDFWIWNNVEQNNNIFGVPAIVPGFRLARPWFDNWLTSTALQVGGRHVVDGSMVLKIYHKKHTRLHGVGNWDDPKHADKLRQDPDWVHNSKLSHTRIRTVNGSLSHYYLGIGTTCEAVFFLSLHDNSTCSEIQLHSRAKAIPCPACKTCFLAETPSSPVLSVHVSHSSNCDSS